MRYRCAHCDVRFESTDELARCPRCLRKSGVEPDRTASTAVAAIRARSPLWLVAGLIAALIELAGFLYGALDPPAGAAGIAAMAGWAAWAVIAAWMIVVGLRGVIARMR